MESLSVNEHEPILDALIYRVLIPIAVLVAIKMTVVAVVGYA